ncbi:substrate-binding periplasmic protein [Bdellovibrio bacteriovorus]|uniref:substrate-binding periplasmic protein n=1 Tax=Bdellovibrio TaxID=958 RepID=UPI0035A89647
MTRFLLFAFLTMFAQLTLAQNSSLRILTENWPPMSFEKSGTPQGMAVELAELLQKRMGAIDKIEVVPWPRAYHLVTTQPNVLLFTMIKTPERQRLVTLLGPIANGEIALFARRSFPDDPRDLQKNYSIGVHRGTAFQKTLEERGFKKIVAVNSPVNNIKMLMAGRIDFVCDDVLVIKELLNQAGYPNDAYKKIRPLYHSSLYFAFSKGTDPKVMNAWKNALEEVKKSGEFKTLHKKWFGDHPAPSEVTLLSPPGAFQAVLPATKSPEEFISNIVTSGIY